MSTFLNKIIYLSQTDYDSLAAGTSVTHGGVTLTGLEDDIIYLTDGTITAADLGNFVIPTTNGGTGLSTIGTSGQVLKVNSAGTGLEWGSSGGSGTVTSVQVQATSPVQSSTSTAQSSTLDTTISLASAYGDTQNPYGSKTKNYVLAAPSSAAGAPSFRALVADDIPSLTKSKISDFPSTMTPSSHTHGNIQNSGTLQTNDITVASGDKLVVTDSSDSSKVARTSISFDGSTTTTALTPKGTFENFYQKPSGGIPASDLVQTDINITKSQVSDFPTSMTPSSHSHGNITNDGDITATAPAIASGDQLVINDHSASKITNGPTFDGSTTTTALTPKGTWVAFYQKPSGGIPGTDLATAYISSLTPSSAKMVTTTVPNITNAGTATSASVSSGILTFTMGNAPTLGTAITVATGSLSSTGSGASVITDVSAS